MGVVRCECGFDVNGAEVFARHGGNHVGMVVLLLVSCVSWLYCPCQAVQAAEWQPLADTGQTKCYDSTGNELNPCPQWNEPYYGQDGNYGGNSLKPAPSFTDNQDGTVTDNNTGLIWKKAAIDVDADGHLDKFLQDQGDRECKFFGDEWRLPSRFELLSMIDFSSQEQFSVFSDRLTYNMGCFWTTTEGGNGQFFCVNPTSAWVHSILPANREYIRCVAGTFVHTRGPYKLKSTYTSSGQQLTTLDVATGLSWFTKHADINDDGNFDSSDKATWPEALSYCKNVTYQGHSDWRLPDIRELESLVTPKTILPQDFMGEKGGYWSSTTDTWQAGTQDSALVVDFNDGSLYGGEKNNASQKKFVRCVRYGIFDFTMHIDGTGSGRVSSADGKIDCGSNCNTTYQANVRVSLSAIPVPHSHFTGWSGECFSSCGGNWSSCSFDVFGDMDCTATFDIDRHTLALTTAGSGSGTVSGGGTYDYGTLTTISATPAVGSRFESWSGDCSGTSDTMLVTVDKDYACTAHFSLNTIIPGGRYTLTVNSAGTGSGTVSGGGTYDYGILTTISATPAAGSVFERWSGDCFGTSSSIFVYMDNDYTCTAMFRKLSANKFPWAMFLPAIFASKHH